MSDEIIPPEGKMPGRYSERLAEVLTQALRNFNKEHDISNSEVLGVLSMMTFRLNQELFIDPKKKGGCDDCEK